MLFRNEDRFDLTAPEHSAKLQAAFDRLKNDKDKKHPYLLDGEFVFGEGAVPSYNPANHKEIIGYVTSASIKDADRAIKAASKAFETYRLTTIKQRIGYINLLVEKLLEARYDLIALIVEECGKNLVEADWEVCETIDFCRSYAMHMLEIEQGVKLLDEEGEARSCTYQPIGVGLVISPWNFPLALLAGMIIAAVITGNTVIAKPSVETPIVAFKFAELMNECGFPKGVFNLLHGSGSVIGQHLAAHPETRFINFTGSKDVGLRINETAGATPQGQKWIKRVVAEMGGKNAIIIDKTADLELAAEGIATSAYGYQGQKCSACSRAIILDEVYDDALRIILDEIKSKHKAGPVINRGAYNFINSYIETGKKEGTLLLGGGSDDSIGFFIEPTVFETGRDAVIAHEEIFGPVLTVIKAKDFAEALEIANDTEYGLTGGVYSKNEDNLTLAESHFNVGNLYFNRKITGAEVMRHPFAGYNLSGTAAKTGTRDYLINFLQLKTITRKV